MIQNSNIKHSAAIFDLFCDPLISFTRLDIPTWMVMSQDKTGSMMINGNLVNLLGINNSSRYSAFGYTNFFKNPVCFAQ